MANRLWDSFDFQEISDLIQELINSSDVHQKKSIIEPQPQLQELEVQMNDQKIQELEPAVEVEPVPIVPVAVPVVESEEKPDVKPEAEFSIGSERMDPLEHALLRMCKRGDFHGAVLADFGGLPLAIYNSPVEGELLAAFTTIMGESLVKAATLLNHTNANNISMDINYVDKIVLRAFPVGESQYFLMIICPQSVDERAEVEVSIAHISEIISRT